MTEAEGSGSSNLSTPETTGPDPVHPEPGNLSTTRPGGSPSTGTRSATSGGKLTSTGTEGSGPLWPGDHGTLPAPARLALAKLIRGPYVAADSDPNIWRALMTHEAAVRERLADQYLDLVTDTDAQVAFVRDVPSHHAPRVVHEVALTFLDTALLLHLRTQLLDASDGRMVISREEVADHLAMYRRHGDSSSMDFAQQLDATWDRLVESGVLESLGPDRFMVSPVLRTMFGADQVAALNAEYARWAKENA